MWGSSGLGVSAGRSGPNGSRKAAAVRSPRKRRVGASAEPAEPPMDGQSSQQLRQQPQQLQVPSIVLPSQQPPPPQSSPALPTTPRPSQQQQPSATGYYHSLIQQPSALISPCASTADGTPTKANTSNTMITPLHLPAPYASTRNRSNRTKNGQPTPMSWEIPHDRFQCHNGDSDSGALKHPHAVTPTPQKQSQQQQQVPPFQRRALHNSHRRRCLNHITPISRQTPPLPDDDLLLRGIHRGKGVVLDLTSMFKDQQQQQQQPAASSRPKQQQLHKKKHAVPPSPTETTATASMSTLMFVTTNSSPLRPPSPMTVASAQDRADCSTTGGSTGMLLSSPVKQQKQQQRQRNPVADTATVSSAGTKSRQDQLECQVLTSWLNFILLQGDESQAFLSVGNDKAQNVTTTPRKTNTSASARTTPTRAGKQETPFTPTWSPKKNTPPPSSTANATTTTTPNRSWKQLLQYHYQWSKVQRQAQQLLHSEAFADLQTRIRAEVARQKLQLRQDRDPSFDVVCRDQLVHQLLTSYSHSWLQLALETLFPITDANINNNNNNLHKYPSVVVRSPPQQGAYLKHFVTHRVLSDDVILSKYNQGRGARSPSGPFGEAYRSELRQVILQRLLELVLFLDRAATSGSTLQVPDTHNNLLFQQRQQEASSDQGDVVKSTRDLVVILCREFFSKEGDIVKHLSRVGLPVFYRQDPLDELMFGISNFALDLRDGMRLARLTELVLQGLRPSPSQEQQNHLVVSKAPSFDMSFSSSASSPRRASPIKSRMGLSRSLSALSQHQENLRMSKYPLLSQLRLPAVSRLQKIHNVNVALQALRDEYGLQLPAGLAAHHIVDGNRSMVLKLIWAIVMTHCFGVSNNSRLLLHDTSADNVCNIYRIAGGSTSALVDQNMFRGHLTSPDQVHTEILAIEQEKLDRYNRRSQHQYRGMLNLLQQEGDAIEDVSEDGLGPDSDDSTVAAQQPPAATQQHDVPWCLSSSFDLDLDDGLSTTSALAGNSETKVFVLQWKTVLMKWCQTVCSLFDHEDADITLDKFSSDNAMLADLLFSKVLCYLVHYYHPSMLSSEDMKWLSTANSVRKTSVDQGRAQGAKQTISEEKQVAQWFQQRPNPAMYMRAVFRCISELGGIPNMLRVTTENQSAKSAAVKSIAPPPDVKSLVVYLYYVCSRLLESRLECQASKRIQIGYRYYRFHTIYRNKRNAARAIFCAWRAQSHRYYECQRYRYGLAVEVIEEFMVNYRSGLENLKAARFQKESEQLAASTIQARVRTFFAVKQFCRIRELHYSAILLQNHFRRHREQLAYKDLRARLLPHIMELQRHWRGCAARIAFLTTIDSAIRLQAFARSAVLVRFVLLQSWHHGATSMQRIWRGFWVQLHYQMELLDIVAVQCLARRTSAIRLARRRSVAAVILQCAGRRFLAMKTLFHKRRQIAAALVCQKFVRRYLARREAAKRRVFIALAHAILVIQRSWRLVRWTRERKSATTRLQAWFRSRVAQSRYSVIRVSLLRLQTKYRQHRAAKSYILALSSIVLIQSLVRRWNYGTVVATKRRRAWETIRNAARRWITHRAIARINARRKLQNLLRRRIARRRLIELREQQRIYIETVTLCQSLCRRYLKVKALAHLKETAIFLQCWWRFRRWTRHLRRRCVLLAALGRSGYFAGRTQSFQLSTSAVKLASSRFRCYRLDRARRGVSTQIPRRPCAHTHRFVWLHARRRSQFVALRFRRLHSVKLQSLQIPRLTKLRRINQTALILQTPWLYGLKQTCTSRTAGTLVPSCVGRHARKQTNRKSRILKTVHTLMTERMDAYQFRRLALRLRSDVRLLRLSLRQSQLLASGLNRITKRSISLPITSTSITEGSAARALKSWLFRWTAGDPFLSRLATLQARSRGYVIRRNNDRQRQSALTIQRYWRRFYAAVRLVQAFWRGCIIRVRRGHNYAAATAIQRVWRGFVVAEEFEVRCACIIAVQSLARRLVARGTIHKRRRALALLHRNAPCWVAVCRMLQLKRERDRRLRQLFGPATFIQAKIRCYLARCEIRLHRAARKIQSRWRCYSTETKFTLMGLCAISVQAYCRCLITKSAYQRSRRGVVLLQARWRGEHDRLLLSERKKSAVVLQSYLRMESARATVCCQLQACRTMQRYYRGFSVRLPLILKNQAAMKIQATWRCYDANAHFIIAVVSAIKIQSAIRMMLGKKHAGACRRRKIRKLLDRQCGTIQVFVRKFLSRKAARRWIRTIVEIQGFIRGYLVRRSVEALVRLSAVRIKDAKERAAKEPGLRLGVRMARALALLKTSRNLAEIMTIVCTIELASRFSKTCCEVFVKASATESLVSLIGTCNRSLPHVELLYYILRCLSNVARFDDLRGEVATLRMANSLMYLIHMYRDEEAIFCNAVMLLDRCARFNSELTEFCRSDACMKRLVAVKAHWVKKLSLAGRAGGPSRNVIEPQFVAKSNSETGMMILGIKYDLSGGVATLDRLMGCLRELPRHQSSAASLTDKPTSLDVLSRNLLTNRHNIHSTTMTAPREDHHDKRVVLSEPSESNHETLVDCGEMDPSDDAPPIILPLSPTMDEYCHCQFSSWYPQFRCLSAASVDGRTNVTIKSHIITSVPEEFSQFLASDGIRLPYGATRLSSCAPVECPGSEHDEDSDDFGDDKDEGSSDDGAVKQFSFPELNESIQAAIDKLGGSVVPKLNWSTPKDATWVNEGTLKCQYPGDVYLLLKSSDFCLHDLQVLSSLYNQGTASTSTPQQDSKSLQITLPPKLEIVLRKWCNFYPSMEFRCFVRDRQLIGISQRNHTQHYPHLLRDRFMIRSFLVEFFDDVVVDRFGGEQQEEGRVDANHTITTSTPPIPNYVFDVYLDQKERVWLLDFNVWCIETDALLFTWDELVTMELPDDVDNGGLPELRVVENALEVRHDPLASYRAPVDTIDLAASSTGCGNAPAAGDGDVEAEKAMTSFESFMAMCAKPSDRTNDDDGEDGWESGDLHLDKFNVLN